LGHKHPIKWIFVVVRQLLEMKSMVKSYGKLFYQICVKLFRYEGLWIVWKFQFADVALYDYFPNACTTQIEAGAAVHNAVTRRIGKLGVVGDQPDKGMRIKQTFHL
jgi:hypothetical protein